MWNHRSGGTESWSAGTERGSDLPLSSPVTSLSPKSSLFGQMAARAAWRVTPRASKTNRWCQQAESEWRQCQSKSKPPPSSWRSKTVEVQTEAITWRVTFYRRAAEPTPWDHLS